MKLKPDFLLSDKNLFSVNYKLSMIVVVVLHCYLKTPNYLCGSQQWWQTGHRVTVESHWALVILRVLSSAETQLETHCPGHWVSSRVTWLPVISYNIHRENLVWEQGITIKQPDSYCHNLQCMDCPKRRKIGWAHARFWSIFYCYLPLTQSRPRHFLWVGKCPDREWGQKIKPDWI